MKLLTKLIEAGVKILDKRSTANKNESIFHEIVGYSDIKKEFVKALDSTSPVSILLCRPPGIDYCKDPKDCHTYRLNDNGTIRKVN
jgi:hypothetical protein